MKKSLHICFVTDEYPPYRQGGIGVFTKTLAEFMVKKGHSVSVLGHYNKEISGYKNINGVNLYLLPKNKRPKISFYINKSRLNNQLKKINSNQKIDIIEAPNISLASISNSFDALKIMRIHSEISLTKGGKFFRKYLIDKTLSSADGIIAVSEFSKKLNSKNLKIPPQLIEVIYNPINTSLFYPRKKNEIQNSIIFVGKISENKGAKDLILAMEKVINEVPDAKLTIVGRDTLNNNKSYKDYILSLISEKTKNAIKFTGPVAHEKIPELIASHQVCVYPSHNENMPIAWLEGMAMGKAVIGSTIEPAYEIIENEKNGLLSEVGNPTSLAKNIIKLLNNKSLRDTIGRNALKTIRTKFDINILINRNLDYYYKLLNKNF